MTNNTGLQGPEAALGQTGLNLSPGQLKQFEAYKNFLLERNGEFNLTAITGEYEIYAKHFADSLSAVEFIDGYISRLDDPSGFSIIDVGSGAGFPGIPIKIARPDIRMTLLDSTRKKVMFLAEAAGLLGLKKISFVHARAEEINKSPGMRGAFDIAVCRAVAPLNKLIGYCAPFIKKGGILLALKGPKVMEEAEQAGSTLRKTGGRIIGIKPAFITLAPPRTEPEVLRHYIAAVGFG